MLDAFFTAARAAEPPVPAALLARVLDDAAAVQPRPAPVPARVQPRPGWAALLLSALGGRGAVAGLAAAGLAGVWIGFAQPVDLGLGLGTGLGLDQTVTLYPGDLDLWSDLLAEDTLPEG